MKNKYLHSLFFLLLVLLASCTEEIGHKVVGGNFTVYFSDVSDEALATNVARYFKRNDLVTGQVQDIKLEKRKQNNYQLKLIANNPELVDDMPFDERAKLLLFQEDLEDEVFKNKRLELVICNDQFEVIYTIN